LRSLVRQATAVELDGSRLVTWALRLLKGEGWRIKAEGLLQQATKPTLEQVSRVVREAEALGLAPDSDPLLAALSEQQSQARGWVEGSKQLLDTLKALAQNQRRTDEEEVMLLVRRAQSHMEGARRLSLKVDRDYDKLAEASRSYCLCHSLYDERRPMIGCDYCNDWFHWECVGLSPPAEDQDDEEVAPADYKCPNCCSVAGMVYPFLSKVPPQHLPVIEQRAEAEKAKRRLALQQGSAYTSLWAGTSKEQRGHPVRLLLPRLWTWA